MSHHMLLALLGEAVGGAPAPEGASVDWDSVLALARSHRVEPLVYYAARTRLDLPEPVGAALAAAYGEALFRDVQRTHAAAAITGALSAAGVPHMLLRGAVLKYDYPAPELRTMSDLDYLVRPEDYPAIRPAMEALGGGHIHTDGGHFSFTLPPGVNVEFHPNLIYAASPVGTAINPGWQYARPGGAHTPALTEEGYYLNLICHLAYHFATGGTGVRSILDVWVYRHRHAPQPDNHQVRTALERAGLLTFAAQVEALAEAWFGDGPLTAELEPLGTFILTGGTHGTQRRAACSAAYFSGGRATALWRRVFYPLDEMRGRYLWLNTYPWLLPLAWALRGAQVLRRRRALMGQWTQQVHSMTAEELRTHAQLLALVGL